MFKDLIKKEKVYTHNIDIIKLSKQIMLIYQNELKKNLVTLEKYLDLSLRFYAS